VPYDFDLQAYQNHKLNFDKVILSTTFAAKIAAIKAKKCLVILDCCHSENIPVEKGLRLIGKSKFATAVDSSLAAMLSNGSGTVLLTSCESNQTALDLGSNGLFTQVLLQCLNGQGNLKNDGWVRLIDLIDFIPKTVAAAAKTHNRNQHPVFKRITDLKGDEYCQVLFLEN
jgi:Caspase domain